MGAGRAGRALCSGGNAVYPSSVVMNVVPAQEAGVESLVVVSPPQKQFDGLPHPTILAAAALLGVDEVWAVGVPSGGIVCLRRYRHRWIGARTGRHDHRPRQHLRHRRKTHLPKPGGHRRRGRADRDRDPGRPYG